MEFYLCSTIRSTEIFNQKKNQPHHRLAAQNHTLRYSRPIAPKLYGQKSTPPNNLINTQHTAPHDRVAPLRFEHGQAALFYEAPPYFNRGGRTVHSYLRIAFSSTVDDCR